LTGNNTYQSTITVNAGRLAVNNTAGSGTGTGPVIVNTGATIGGSGTVGGVLTVNTGGTIAPGNSSGTLSVGSNTTVAGTYAFELTTAGTSAAASTGGSSPALPHIQHDVISVTGTLTFTGSILNINSGAGSTGLVNTNPYSWLIATASGGITGTPTLGTVSGVDFVAAQTSGGTFTVDTVGNNLFLNFTPVPEPATVLGLAAGAMGLAGLIRRRMRKAASGATLAV
jgi:hypothetical protein